MKTESIPKAETLYCFIPQIWPPWKASKAADKKTTTTKNKQTNKQTKNKTKQKVVSKMRSAIYRVWMEAHLTWQRRLHGASKIFNIANWLVILRKLRQTCQGNNSNTLFHNQRFIWQAFHAQASNHFRASVESRARKLSVSSYDESLGFRFKTPSRSSTF